MEFPETYARADDGPDPIPVRLRPSKEFLERLAWYIRFIGWSVDKVEVDEFFRTLCRDSEVSPEDFTIGPAFPLVSRVCQEGGCENSCAEFYCRIHQPAMDAKCWFCGKTMGTCDGVARWCVCGNLRRSSLDDYHKESE